MNRIVFAEGLWRFVTGSVVVVSMLVATSPSPAGPAAQYLPRDLMLSGRPHEAPVSNAAFVPAADAEAADALHLELGIRQTVLTLEPELAQPVCDGRPVELGGSCRGGADKRLFPGVLLELYSFDDDTRLGAVQVGQMIPETEAEQRKKSYWHVIPQYGRVWKEAGEEGWSRAAFPLMLVHNFENVAHQGLATFLYKGDEVSNVRLQFVQQSTPWNTPEHFVAWGVADAAAKRVADSRRLAQHRAAAEQEIRRRVEAKPWSELERQYSAGALAGFGGPLRDKWVVMHAAVKDGVVYYQDSATPYGPYPYPEEMRFGIRSMTKSVTAPLALARLAQVYGPYVLNLKIGDYVDGLHPGYDAVRFIDAANMATGMGGSGSPSTVPNDGQSGYVDETYDDWYNAAKSAAEKIEAIVRDTGSYPWEPGVVFRYRDRDHHLLGMAADRFLKSVRGPEADIWEMLGKEVFRPIGIYHAPIVRTVESDGSRGLPWFHAGYYPTLDDIAKIGMLYQRLGSVGDQQILHPGVTAELFTPEGGLIKDFDHSLDAAFSRTADLADYAGKEVYKMGVHFSPYVNSEGIKGHIPTMSGFSGTRTMLHPNGLISIRFAKAWPLPDDEQGDVDKNDTIDIVDRLP
jgi:CubicO group peptidase (beta-lactamase class C family)